MVKKVVKKENIDERLTRINNYWTNVLAKAGIDNDEQLEKTIPQALIENLGLTYKEAVAWLRKEPNYLSDVGYHEPRNRRRVNRTLFSTHSSTYHNIHRFPL